MASIKDSTNQDLSGYEPVTNPAPPPASAPNSDTTPVANPFLRCPLPPIFSSNPDALRQFYSGNQVPKSRLLTPLPNTNTFSGTLNESVFIAGGGSGGSGGSSTVNINSTSRPTSNDTYLTSLYTQQVVLQTPQVAPGASYIGQVFSKPIVPIAEHSGI